MDLLDHSPLKVIRPKCLNSWYRVTRNSEIFCQPQSTFWHPKKNKKWQFFIPKKVKLFKSGIARWFSRLFIRRPPWYHVCSSGKLWNFAKISSFQPSTTHSAPALCSEVFYHCRLIFMEIFLRSSLILIFLSFYHYFGNCYFYLKVCEAISLIAIREVDLSCD